MIPCSTNKPVFVIVPLALSKAPLVDVGLKAVDCTDSKKLSHAAIVAEGYTIVDVAVPEP